MNDTTRATRTMYEHILRRLAVLVGVLIALGATVGYLLAGAPGVWGALMAAGIAALFMVGTVVTMMITADQPLPIATAAGVGGWGIKTILLVGVLVLVRGRDFYSPGVFFVVLVLAIIGSLVIEMTQVLRARVPNVEPGSHAPDARDPGAEDAAD